MDYARSPDETQASQNEALSLGNYSLVTSDEASRNEESSKRESPKQDVAPSELSLFKVEDGGMNPDEFPEGGREAWTTVFGSACLLFLSQGAVSAFGVYQDYYTRIFLNEKTPSEIAWIGSMQLFLIFACGLPMGKLFDDGYIRQLMFVGSAIYIFSYFMLSLAKPHHFYEVFLAQGLGVGIGMGILYIPSLSICFHYFKRKRGLVAGVASLGGAVGAIVQTIGLNHLINGPVGFAWGVRIFGFIFLALAVLGNLLIRPRLPPKKLRSNVQPPNIKKIVTDIPFALGNAAASLLTLTMYFPYFYIQLFAILHGLSPNLSFYTITIMNGANIFGRVLWGFIADKIGPLNAVICTTTCMGITSFTLIKATTVHGLIPFTIFYGIFSGGYFGIAGASVSAYVDDINDFGFAIGYSSFISSFSILVSEPVAGQLLDVPRYRWNRAIIFVSTILLGAPVLAAISRMLLVRRKNTWRT